MQNSQVELRLWTPEDAEFLCSLRNHPDLKKWFRQEGVITLAEEIAFINSNFDYKGFIITRDDGTQVGYVALVFHGNDKEAEFSIAVHPKYQGRGYAKQALNLLCDFATHMFGLERIYSDVFSHNPALGMYTEKCGFQITKTTRDYCYKQGQGFVDAVEIERWLKP